MDIPDDITINEPNYDIIFESITKHNASFETVNKNLTYGVHITTFSNIIGLILASLIFMIGGVLFHSALGAMIAILPAIVAIYLLSFEGLRIIKILESANQHTIATKLFLNDDITNLYNYSLYINQTIKEVEEEENTDANI